MPIGFKKYCEKCKENHYICDCDFEQSRLKVCPKDNKHYIFSEKDECFNCRMCLYPLENPEKHISFIKNYIEDNFKGLHRRMFYNLLKEVVDEKIKKCENCTPEYICLDCRSYKRDCDMDYEVEDVDEECEYNPCKPIEKEEKNYPVDEFQPLNCSHDLECTCEHCDNCGMFGSGKCNCKEFINKYTSQINSGNPLKNISCCLINVKNNSGNTLLIEAVLAQNKDIVSYLLRECANVTIPDKNGNTPLIHSVLLENKEIYNLFLSHHTRLSYDLRNNKGKSAGDYISLLNLAWGIPTYKVLKDSPKKKIVKVIAKRKIENLF